MSRAYVFALALAVVAPSQAFACGMYIPEEDEKMLAQVFEEIDAVAPAPVVTASKDKNAANAAALARPADVKAPVIAEVTADKTES